MIVVHFLLFLNLIYVRTSSGAGGGEEFALSSKSGPSWNETFLNQNYITKTGTTIVGLCCKDGVVLGADTRSTGGPVVVDKNKLKIHNIAPKLFACAAGTSADCDHLCRRAKKVLSILAIESELSGEFQTLSSVASAVDNLCESLWSSSSGRRPSAVFIVGGLDNTGSKLYQIDSDAVPLRVPYGSLGSGCTDALAVLESRCAALARPSSSQPDIDSFVDISVEEGVEIVRKAVQAGILNDLGSGSHVDLCAITEGQVKMWREKLISTWDQDKLKEHDGRQNKTLLRREEGTRLVDVSVLGRKVWSPRHIVSKIKQGKVYEEEVVSDPTQTFIDIQEI